MLMTDKVEKINIILDDMKFGFTEDELKKIVSYWNEYSKTKADTIEKTKRIAKDVGLNTDNTFLVILYLARTGRI